MGSTGDGFGYQPDSDPENGEAAGDFKDSRAQIIVIVCMCIPNPCVTQGNEVFFR